MMSGTAMASAHVELNDANIALAQAQAEGALAERVRIAAMLREEEKNIPEADAKRWRSAALFVEANGSWERVDELVGQLMDADHAENN